MKRQREGYWEFVRAYLEFRRCQNKHRDLADFYTRRYRAFCTILGIDLAESPDAGEEAWERSALHGAFDEVIRFYLTISTPFVGYVEAPAGLVRIAEPYESRLKKLASEQKEVSLDLLCELAHAIYGPCERQIGEDELERLGVAKSLAPDPYDYF